MYPSRGWRKKTQAGENLPDADPTAHVNFPEKAPYLDPSSVSDAVCVSQRLWSEIYGVLRRFPCGLDHKTLGIEFALSNARPLGGADIYKKCHVRSLHQLLLALPDTEVLEIQPGVIGYRLRRPDEQRRSTSSKNKMCDKIAQKAEKLKFAKSAVPKLSEDEDFHYEDEEALHEVHDESGTHRFKIPPQPAHLVPYGGEISQGLRAKIYNLLRRRYADGIDMVLFNERYSQFYRTTINPQNQCNLGLMELFQSMTDILTVRHDKQTKLTIITPKVPAEIMRLALNSLDVAGEVDCQRPTNYLESVRATPGRMPNDFLFDESEYADDIYKVMSLFEEGRTGILVERIPSLFDYLQQKSHFVSESVKSDLPNFLKRFPEKFECDLNLHGVFVAKIRKPGDLTPEEILEIAFGPMPP